MSRLFKLRNVISKNINKLESRYLVFNKTTSKKISEFFKIRGFSKVVYPFHGKSIEFKLTKDENDRLTYIGNIDISGNTTEKYDNLEHLVSVFDDIERVFRVIGKIDYISADILQYHISEKYRIRFK
jgi:hypothetical protein